MVSVPIAAAETGVSHKQNGAIGVDLNEHHISFTHVNAKGNKVSSTDHTFTKPSYRDTSKQAQTGLGEAVKGLLDAACRHKTPIIIEDLDFKKKRGAIKAGENRVFNRTVSSLVTAKFLALLTLRCAERGIELIKVNPAYTSLIGRLKYANQFNYNIHQAAAMVIARRGLGLSDRSMPKYVMCVVSNSLQYFGLPEDSPKMTIGEYFKKVRGSYDAWFSDIDWMLRAKRKSPPQHILQEDINF
ncbi:MAG: IS605 OrfB family transposase [Paraglaciecola sp.]|jgi:IS605 OrfB family transposase